MIFGSKCKINVGRLIRKKKKNNYLEELSNHTANVLGHKVEKDSVKQSTFLTATVKWCTYSISGDTYTSTVALNVELVIVLALIWAVFRYSTFKLWQPGFSLYSGFLPQSL